MRLRPLLVTLLLAALTCGLLGPAQADDKLHQQKRAADEAAAALRNSLADVQQDVAAAVVAQKQAADRLDAARQRESAAEYALDTARQKDAALAARLHLAEGEQAQAEKDVAETASQLDAGRRQVGSLARQAYTSGRSGTLDVFLDATSPQDFADRIQMVQGALRSQGSVVRQLNALRADLRSRQAAVTAKKQQIAGLKAQAAANVVVREDAEAAAASARQSASSASAEAASATATLKGKEADERARLAAQEAEGRRLAGLIRQRAIEAAARERARIAAEERAAAKRAAAARAAAQARDSAGSGSSGGSSGSDDSGSSGGSSGGGTTTIGGGTLSRPNSGPITSPYGMRLHPVLHVWKLHDGTDFGAACGTPIHAAADGTVIWAQNLNGYGNQLAIDHGIINGVPVVTSYSHQERFAVGVGTHVSRGQVIGYTGQTGYATGCHVHFMVYVNGATVNPVGWL
ncbi:peptidase M23-like protein [Motilibacter peucedani]|uniref:Peptidase M23-like protein n=1 Tax=Motilibacter peucedani TaxID=598650 RepID=A0A420XN32_9ACTN|nr:peptidoglycan DD-metalloendopeptidase family protein [Motilibacter peucedani]RKS72694.1 peptidase M23-like protein [Motilibacter peucedani]